MAETSAKPDLYHVAAGMSAQARALRAEADQLQADSDALCNLLLPGKKCCARWVSESQHCYECTKPEGHIGYHVGQDGNAWDGFGRATP